MATLFFSGPRRDPYLARMRNDGMATPEIFWEKSRQWAPYPELDTLHAARRISESEALVAIPGVTREELSRPAIAS